MACRVLRVSRSGYYDWLRRVDGPPVGRAAEDLVLLAEIRQVHDQFAYYGSPRIHRQLLAHHVRAWADGGATALGNAALICEHHHRVSHCGEWTVQIAPDGHPEFLPPAYIDPDRKPIRNTVHRRIDTHPRT
jgi:hypothetical protein